MNFFDSHKRMSTSVASGVTRKNLGPVGKGCRNPGEDFPNVHIINPMSDKYDRIFSGHSFETFKNVFTVGAICRVLITCEN